MKEDDMDGTCSMYGREEKCVQNCGWKNQKERNNLANLSVDGS
jgi:hypothetical protein